MPTDNRAHVRGAAGRPAPPILPSAQLGRGDDALALAILDHLSVAVLLCDEDARCTFMNKCGSELLASSDGVRLLPGETLDAEYPGDAQKLRSAIQKACLERLGSALMINRTIDPHALIGVVVPFEADTVEPPQAILMLRRASIRGDVVAQHLRSLFRLSPAEADIAVALSTGAELPEIASSRAVTVNTLRSQIASVMGKTGTRRQAELVALVSKLDTVLR